MKKGALALLVHGGTENWSPERWKSRFDDVCGGRRVWLLPDPALDPAEVHLCRGLEAAPGELAAFPNLRVIFNLGAGVDALMADQPARGAAGARRGRRPHRANDGICRAPRADASSAGTLLAGLPARETLGAEISMAGRAITVGIMGLGTLGADAAGVLRRLGFGWSAGAAARKQVEGVACFHGEGQLEAFLRQTDILVCLLPLTPDTRQSSTAILHKTQPR